MRYVDILLTPMERSDYWHVAAMVMKILHGAISNLGGAVGISFPQWRDNVVGERGAMIAPQDPGDLFRLVGAQEDLEKVVGDMGRAVDNGLARVVRFGDVPENAMAVRFVRDRQIEKSRSGDRSNIHFFKFESAENGNRFSLAVRREKGGDLHKGFSNYGLSKDGSAVPAF